MNNTKRKYALIAGISLIAMALVAGYTYGYVYATMVNDASPDETYQSLKSSTNVFVGGIIGWIVIFLLDLLTAWGLYHFLKEINPTFSIATATTRIIYTLILGMAIYKLTEVIPLIENVSSIPQIMDKLESFESLWSNGLIIFGLHLFGLGILILKSEVIPKILGYLLLFAGICYTGINFSKAVVTSQLDQIISIEMILSLPMAVAEIGFAIWLIVKGGKKQL